MRNRIADAYFRYRYFREFWPDIIWKYFIQIVLAFCILAGIGQFFFVPELAAATLIVR